MSGLELNYRYIVSGFFESAKKDTDTYKKGDIVPLEKSFDTRRMQVVMAQALNNDKQPTGKQEIWTTSPQGIAYKSKDIGHRNIVYTMHNNWRLSLPPNELLSGTQLFAQGSEIDTTGGDSQTDAQNSLWEKTLLEFYQNKNKPMGGIAEPYSLSKKHFVLPLSTSELSEFKEGCSEAAYQDELEYHNWYHSLDDKEALHCLALLQQRSFFFFFNDPIYENIPLKIELIKDLENTYANPKEEGSALKDINKELEIYMRKVVVQKAKMALETVRQKELAQEFKTDHSQTYFASLISNPKYLVKGIYKITIPLIIDDIFDISPTYYPNPTQKKELTFLHHAHFSIKNDLGEFEMAMLSPETLEDAIISHFPKRYAHLIQMMNSQGIHTTIAAMAKPGAVKTSSPVPFNWAKNYLFKQDKIAFINGALKGNLNIKADVWNTPGVIFGLMQGANTDALTEKLKESAQAVFATIDQYKEVQKFFKTAKIIQGIEKALLQAARVSRFKDINYQDLKNFQKFKMNKLAVEHAQTIAQKVLEIQNNQKLGQEISKLDNMILGIATNESPSFNQKLFEDMLTKRQNIASARSFKANIKLKGIAAIDVGLSLYSLYTCGATLNKMSNALANNIVIIKDLFQEYSKYGAYPFPQLNANLDKNLSLCVAAERGLDQAHLDAMNSAIDLTLGVLSCIPVVNFVAIPLMLIKTSAELVVNNASTLIDLSLTASRSLGMNAFPKYKDYSKNLEISQNHECYEDVLEDLLAKAHEQTNEREISETATAFFARGMAIAGFIQLINKIAEDIDTDDAAKFERVFKSKARDKKKYDLKGYIDHILFNDNWAKMDANSPFTFVERDSNLKSVAISSLMMLTIGPIAALGAYNIWRTRNEDLKKNLAGIQNQNNQGQGLGIRSFNTYFPIHGLSEGKRLSQIADMAYGFCQSAKKFQHEKPISSAQIFVKKWIPSKNSALWKDITWEKNWTRITYFDIYKKKHIHSLDQVIVVVTFEKGIGFENNIVPLKFQIKRSDYCPDIKGPDHECIAEPLAHILPRGLGTYFSKDQIQQYGAVFKPTYHIGNHLFNGIKPIIPSEFFLSENLAKWLYHDDIDDMRYQIELSIGKNHPLNIRFRDQGTPSHRGFDELHVISITNNASADIKKYEEKIINSPEFLKGTTADKTYPNGFENMKIGGLWFKDKPGTEVWQKVATADLDQDVTFKNVSDWNKYSEIIAIFLLDKETHKEVVEGYDQADSKEWKNTPISLTLMEDSNTGPTYTSNLQFLGILKNKTGVNGEKDTYVSNSSEVDLKFKHLRNSLRSAKPSRNPAIYAAHFNIGYRNPFSGEKIPGIRPFSSYGKWGRDLNIKFRFSSATGINTTPDYEIIASDNFDDDLKDKEYPWRLDKNGKLHANFDPMIEKSWFVNYPTLSNIRMVNSPLKKNKNDASKITSVTARING